jgi:hypothetical protein
MSVDDAHQLPSVSCEFLGPWMTRVCVVLRLEARVYYRTRRYSVKREELRRPRHGGISASRTARNCNFSILHLAVPCISTGAGSSSISIVVPIIIYEVLVCP